MALEKFNDLESLSSVRTKINATIDKVNALGLAAETHTPVLTFDKNKYTETAISQSAAIAYTLAGTGNVDGVVIRHKILSDGVNPITFSADFNVFNISTDNIYPSGIHILYFNYVGGEVDVVIPTYNAETAPVDTTAPTIISATVENANPSTLVVVFSEVVTITDVTGLTIAGAATPTLSIPTGSGTNTLSFTLSAPLTSGQTVTLEVAGTNNIIDGASNALVAISQAITNNVGVAVSELVVFEQFVSASSPSAGELVNEAGGSAWSSGAYGTKAFNGAGTVTFDAPVVGTSSGGLIAVTNAYTGIVGSNFNFDMGVALVANSPGYTVIHGGVTEPELAWNGETAKLNVRADGFVEIFMDDTLVYTSAQAYTFPLNVVGLLLDSRTNSVIHNATLTSSNLITSTI